jgi:hypothetical protein
MSIFTKIKDAIFGAQAQAKPAPTPAPAPTPTPRAAPTPGSGTVTAAPKPASPPTPTQPVDVEAVLNGLASSKGQKLNWRSSIVDLMKLLDLDSSLQHRKELAAELGYKGDTNDSATMNIWLHKQVMTQLAANGGKVPADLRD